MESVIYKMYSINCPSIFYIGSAIDFSKRKIRHRHQLKKGIHKNIRMQRIYDKYGKDSIRFDVIELVSDINFIIKREQYFIDTLNPKINILKTAGSCLGFKHKEETKLYLSSINKGKKMSLEQVINNSLAQKGNKNAQGSRKSLIERKHLSEIKKRKVKNICTGKIYNSIGDASCEVGIKYSTLYAKLSGRNSNTTNLCFL